MTVCRAVRLFVTSMDGCSILQEIMIDRIVWGRAWAALYKISLKTLSPLIRTASFFGVCVSGYLLVRMIYFPANQIGNLFAIIGTFNVGILYLIITLAFKLVAFTRKTAESDDWCQWNDKFHYYIVFAVLWLLNAFVFFLLYRY